MNVHKKFIWSFGRKVNIVCRLRLNYVPTGKRERVISIPFSFFFPSQTVAKYDKVTRIWNLLWLVYSQLYVDWWYSQIFQGFVKVLSQPRYTEDKLIKDYPLWDWPLLQIARIVYLVFINKKGDLKNSGRY